MASVSNTTIAIDFGIICRLCLTDDAKFINIYAEISPLNISQEGEAKFEVKSIILKFMSITRLQIEEKDVLPHWICTACFSKLQEILNFIDMCTQSQDILDESVSKHISEKQTVAANEELPAVQNIDHIKHETETEATEDMTFELLEPYTSVASCDDCSRLFDSKHELAVHRISIHHDDLVDINGADVEVPWSCDTCQVELTSEQAYRIHIQSHTRKNERNPFCRKLEIVSCRYCGDNYSNNDWLGHCKTIHNVSKLKDKKSYDCKACLRPFLRLSALWNHVQCNHPERLSELAGKNGLVWKCRECNFECQVENELSKHNKEVHGWPVAKQKTSRLQTCQCGYIMVNPLEDRLHEIFLHRIEDGDCPGCEMKFNSFLELINHVVSYHSFLTAGLDSHCVLCEETCSDFQQLKLHLQEKHQIVRLQGSGVEKAWKCAKKDCDVTLSAMELVEHGRTEHGMESLYYCETCDCCFETEGDLSDHVCSDADNQPEEIQPTETHTCPDCFKTFPSKMNLHNHFKRRHLGAVGPFVCSFCGKRLKGRVALRSHEDRLHRGIRKFPCPECPLAFTTAGILRKHTEIHMAERPLHTCGVCGRKFTTVSGYSRHVATHDGNKNFICSVDPCRKAFYTKGELRRHIKFHTQDFHHECNVCGHKFVSPGDLRKHLTKHTGLRPFQCHICSAKYARRDDKVKHMKRVHHLRAKRIYGASSGEVYIKDEPVQSHSF